MNKRLGPARNVDSLLRPRPGGFGRAQDRQARRGPGGTEFELPSPQICFPGRLGRQQLNYHLD